MLDIFCSREHFRDHIDGQQTKTHLLKNTGMLFMYNVAINTICIYPSGLMYFKCLNV